MKRHSKLIIISIFFLFFLFFLIYLFNKSLITFIIPSIGRDTLPRTIESLKNLNNPRWNAIVIFDGVEPTITSDDSRITIIKLDKKLGQQKNNAGYVRNHAFPYVHTEWVGFVDDDDMVEPTYVDRLSEYSDYDVVIFRMKYMKKDLILPPLEDIDENHFKEDQVGISFCLRTALTSTFQFEPSDKEDFYLLDQLRSNGKKIAMSPYIEYIVG